MSEIIVEKQHKKKELLLEQLKKIPIVQLACERSDIGRATFYRWKKEDAEFATAVNEALTTGNSLVNDMAESKLISAIKDQNMTGILFWLKHHHPAYATRVELAMKQPISEQLTPEQEQIIQQALQLASLTTKEDYENPTITN
ncbi:MAG: hypothetical protein A3D99_01035 [Candidatus Andersenbacteria bacterium RIFCSPHIGHO2_12_FULL_45_11]|uniref:Homeodomain phBC6A51-type domain-containing protein n=1 Tax=Candidatus Andersenbacteria bacterium RIFCSPHIGHO2_12_FULL_45_11 TaxID=1797281 RepID=A0A1G1X6N5_9BACT|nr:MAG: hypothetical protein A3D99_01035 [Candidatus Andersenbacteria bacterium RIFCSPHIGHO2_12_FULL_45_11]